MNYLPEKQLTHDLSYNHDLDNNDNFSPDNQWLVYDTRTEEGGIAASAKIEKVNIETREKIIVYQVANNHEWGPGVGAASYSPTENAVVFIHGLASVTENNPYQQWRRTGVIIDEANVEKPIFMDARDIYFPYTKGALRGGTHRHEWSGNGQWIGFTYNDAIMKALEDSTGEKRNLRTIGVAKKDNPVSVKQNNNGENIAGEWFSSIVVRVVANPKFGSDEISNAAGDSWVGKNGYLKPDGKRQMARAFIGTVRNKNGESVDEVFIVDIPNEIDVEGEYGALEGTKNVLPMPPKGATQRRLTFTAESESAGCIGIVRSSPEGDLLAFLAKDKQNVRQIFTINPNGENLNQITFHKTDVEGSLRWHPSGKSVFYICAGSIHQCEIGFGDFETRVQQISKPSYISPTNLVISHDGKILAFNRAITRGDGAKHSKQIYIIKLND
ncbi:hypothetical protein EMA8858_00909 [Emticicia aquatica]|uniref:DUF3748 domain-containing protein n=1 Tax=Emticicia aquatica TaxID=1681835 RepID=A0ABN8EPE8_9BACT|nr:DUF3748 domain-containing protein [Emticicia aquatica]CAH0994797.1 hypothetical protein EMA8858_00909 [Emticicia aquatica]